MKTPSSSQAFTLNHRDRLTEAKARALLLTTLAQQGALQGLPIVSCGFSHDEVFPLLAGSGLASYRHCEQGPEFLEALAVQAPGVVIAKASAASLPELAARIEQQARAALLFVPDLPAGGFAGSAKGLTSVFTIETTAATGSASYQVLAYGLPQFAQKRACEASSLGALAERITNPAPGKKLGTMRRVVLLMSRDQQKLPEYERNFRCYGIEVYQVEPGQTYDHIKNLLSVEVTHVRILALLQEENEVVCIKDGKAIVDYAQADLAFCRHKCHLTAYRLDAKQALTGKSYTHATKGYIDNKRAALASQAAGEDVFGWDDVFVVAELNRTYHELRGEGQKISSRDMNISKYIHEFVHYQDPINLKFGEKKNERVVDFSNCVLSFVREHPVLGNPAAQSTGIFNFFYQSALSGIFFRAPLNRRQKNYWWPGLNAGLPFTPKGDALHEITYMAHDFIHFIIPDLIFTGAHSPVMRKVYIIYRMLSEAITLVFADMLFADTLRRAHDSGYDYTKRAIHPLYLACGLPCTTHAELRRNIRPLLEANVAYCLRGDDGPYRQLLAAQGQDLTTLDAFKAKYMPFFVEDFRWTARNYDNLLERQAVFARWWRMAGKVRAFAGLELETIEEFTMDLPCDLNGSSEELISAVFESIFARRLLPILLQAPGHAAGKDAASCQHDNQAALSRAFGRYLMGQLGLCSQFAHLEESRWYAKRLIDFMQDEAGKLTVDKIDRAREFFSHYASKLCQKNLISLDDASTYKEIYPLFEPFYVHYDEDKSFYLDLSVLSKQILA